MEKMGIVDLAAPGTAAPAVPAEPSALVAYGLGWRDLLVSLTFLSRLDATGQAQLLELGRARRYPAHSILFFECDDAHDVLIVRTGEIKVSITVEGHEVLLDVLGAGDVLGELSAIDGGPRSATATALSAAEVVAIQVPAFMGFLTEHPVVALDLMRSVAGRLRDASRRQVEYGALDAVGRVCRRLVEMMNRYGVPAGTGVLIDAPLSQADIAGWAGLSREAVVKALHALRALGWVSTTPRCITVHDVDAVTTRASITAA
jgi:CRP-like cAMP-binding protein